MSSFTGFDAGLYTYYDPEASKALGADHWRITRGFTYFIDHPGSRWAIQVPYGYLTDGASVPGLFQNIVSPWGPWGQAAVGHDILCEYLTISEEGKPVSITRKQADDYLLEMMTVLDVPAWRREVIYSAVRAYAITCRVTQPSTTAFKRKLEADWVAANPEYPTVTKLECTA